MVLARFGLVWGSFILVLEITKASFNCEFLAKHMRMAWDRLHGALNDLGLLGDIIVPSLTLKSDPNSYTSKPLTKNNIGEFDCLNMRSRTTCAEEIR